MLHSRVSVTADIGDLWDFKIDLVQVKFKNLQQTAQVLRNLQNYIRYIYIILLERNKVEEVTCSTIAALLHSYWHLDDLKQLVFCSIFCIHDCNIFVEFETDRQ